MEDDMANSASLSSLLEQIKPYVTDAATYGRLRVDFQDLAEACEWFLSIIKDNEGKVLKSSEIEDILVDIDIHFVQHVSFHLKSFRKNLNRTLNNFPEERSDEE
jgi:hypothetical protein